MADFQYPLRNFSEDPHAMENLSALMTLSRGGGGGLVLVDSPRKGPNNAFFLGFHLMKT